MAKLFIPRTSDKKIATFLSEVHSDFKPQSLSGKLLDGRPFNADRLQKYLNSEKSTHEISTFSLNWNEVNPQNQHISSNLVISFSRAQPDSNQDYDPYCDTIQIDRSGQLKSLTSDEQDTLLESISAHFNTEFYSSTGDRQNVRQANKLFSGYMEAVENINGSINQFSRQLTEIIKIADERVAQQRAADRKQHEELRRELQQQYESKNIELRNQQDEIARQKKELDDRSNTHARREIRRDLINLVDTYKSNSDLSLSANLKRRGIHIAFISTMISFFALFFSFSYFGNILTFEQNQSIDIQIVKFIKGAIPTLGFFATAIVYIRWMNSWAHRHADFEFNQRQFELDINRASWAVESALEWKESQGTPMPSTLLSGMTHGLFEPNHSKNDDGSALDALASALLGSSRARLRIGDHELEFGQKDLKKLSETKLG